MILLGKLTNLVVISTLGRFLFASPSLRTQLTCARCSEGQPTLTRAEKVLESVIGHPTICFPSGINAFFALLLHVNPDVIAIGTKDGPGCSFNVLSYLSPSDRTSADGSGEPKREQIMDVTERSMFT